MGGGTGGHPGEKASSEKRVSTKGKRRIRRTKAGTQMKSSREGFHWGGSGKKKSPQGGQGS